MIYVDSSVVLARLFAEDRRPSEEFWSQSFASSRLLQFEVWTRLNARGASRLAIEEAGEVLDWIFLVDMTEQTLARALSPFPTPLRTLDSLHLATVVHLMERGQTVELASYDRRMLAVAREMNIATIDL